MYLESGGHTVVATADGISALEIVKGQDIDLALLDVMMPGMDGFTLTAKIRELKNIPIMILTAKVTDNDKIQGLNLGADDYITKPFNPLEILARVNANLRRAYSLDKSTDENNGGVTLTLGELCLDTDKMLLTKNGEEVVLTPNEYKLLSHMMKNPGRVYTKSQLCEAVNGEFYDNYENAIMVHISHIRDKIEDDPKAPRYIKNIRGVGYKIEK
jgi:DNA-binding response OmpR family regulator